MEDSKYVVFKREEYEAFVKLHGGAGALELPDPLVDAVVIRRQDLFAGPALHTYAASIAIAVKITGDVELGAVGDYFHEQAVLADEEGFKIPD